MHRWCHVTLYMMLANLYNINVYILSHITDLSAQLLLHEKLFWQIVVIDLDEHILRL